MNDRFTDMGFSQGHQSCGGRSILRFNLFRFSALAYSRLLFFWHLRKQEGGRVVKVQKKKENTISVKRSFISPLENLPLSLPYLHIRVVSST
jgi:hypothetical protein